MPDYKKITDEADDISMWRYFLLVANYGVEKNIFLILCFFSIYDIIVIA